jgi:trehalose synthase
MGITVKNFVRENFLLTRQLREHLTLMFALQYGSADRIELG